MKAAYENHYLTDNDVANYARHSFADLAKNFTKEQNHKLIQFLARGMARGNWMDLIQGMLHMDSLRAAEELAIYLRKIPEHWVPFGHPHITVRVSAPIPIARQAFKHKVGFVESEESRRYIRTQPKIFIPGYFREAADNAKQGSVDAPHPQNRYWISQYEQITKNCVDAYMDAIECGICPEQARFFLPQGAEVNWVLTGSLYAFANFYNQRSDSHAQKEIQYLAGDLNEIIQPLFPVSWPALTQGEY